MKHNKMNLTELLTAWEKGDTDSILAGTEYENSPLAGDPTKWDKGEANLFQNAKTNAALTIVQKAMIERLVEASTRSVVCINNALVLSDRQGNELLDRAANLLEQALADAAKLKREG